jgi:uncharacterized membrane-anchored protein YhcB (DUF1043 family)
MASILLVIVTLAIGVVAGYVLRAIFFDSASSIKKLQEELDKTKNQFRQYQLQVNDHLIKTADLVNGMQQNFSTLQDHVLISAQTLNLDTNKQSVLQPNSHYIQYQGEELEIDDTSMASQHGIEAVAPPKDYA